MAHPSFVDKASALVRIRSLDDIVQARQEGRAVALSIGFSPADQTIIVAAIAEMANNIVTYASEGEIRVTIINDNGRKRGIEILASDRGPGIPDIAAVMRDFYSTGPGLGIGLPGVRRLMDEFEIVSKVGEGTTIRMRKWL